MHNLLEMANPLATVRGLRRCMMQTPKFNWHVSTITQLRVRITISQNVLLSLNNPASAFKNLVVAMYDCINTVYDVCLKKFQDGSVSEEFPYGRASERFPAKTKLYIQSLQSKPSVKTCDC